MAAQTILNAVSSNGAGSWFDVTDDFCALVRGLRYGEVVVIEVATSADDAKAVPCGIDAVFTVPDVRILSTKGAWKVRARASGLSSGSAVTCEINQ